MEPTPSVALPLIQFGILLGIVVLGHALAVRHLPLESVPGVLMGRVRLGNRLRPWLNLAALTTTAAGILLLLR